MPSPQCPVRRRAERPHQTFTRQTARVALPPRAVLFLPSNFVASPKENFMKITVNTLKPRNPLVAPAHFRRAGEHRPRGSSMRQQAGRALRRELDQFKQHSP